MDRVFILRYLSVFSIWLGCIVTLFVATPFTLYAQKAEFVSNIVRVAGIAPGAQPAIGAASNGPATSAALNAPEGIAVDKGGNLLFWTAIMA